MSLFEAHYYNTFLNWYEDDNLQRKADLVRKLTPNLYTCLYKVAYLRLTEGFVFEPPEEGETFTDADFSRLEALASRVARDRTAKRYFWIILLGIILFGLKCCPF
jgi:hypothetical protein